MEDKGISKDEREDTAPHFDMYHFFSRKDVIAAGLFLLALLLFLVWAVFFRSNPVA